jgi:hypothetical protein
MTGIINPHPITSTRTVTKMNPNEADLFAIACKEMENYAG